MGWDTASVRSDSGRRRAVPRKPAPVGRERETVADAEYRARLVALRDRLESAVLEAAHRDLAPLSARYADVLDRLAALPEVAEVDVVDEFAARRARASKPSRSARPAAG